MGNRLVRDTALKLLVFIGALLCVAAPLFSQTDAHVSGTVTDPSGAHVIGATVTALNGATGAATPVQTNDAGVYTMPSLPPGTYTFSAEHPGFRKAVIPQVELQVGSVLTLNMGLDLGQTTETVEVQALATAVNATSASVGSVVEGKRLLDLPWPDAALMICCLPSLASNWETTTISTATRAAL